MMRVLRQRRGESSPRKERNEIVTATQETAGWTKDRPKMPGYGVPEGTDGTLEMATVAALVAAGKNYWVCTASEDGKPHAVPVWGAYLDGTLYFGAGPRSSRNLDSNPRVSIHLESGTEVVILEGVATRLLDPDAALSKALDDHMADKYEWRPSSECDEPVGEGWRVLAPDRIIAWTSFPADATRWTRQRPSSTDQPLSSLVTS